jgi:hypothetical protein
MGAAAWPERCLRDIVNLLSRQRRKDWHSVRKGACVWGYSSGAEGAARQTLSPGDRADPGLASVRGLLFGGGRRPGEAGMAMPAFGDAYSDVEIAAAANYVTARFGAVGSRLTAENVASLRLTR